MSDINDDTDFNKARSFLLTYSGIILALWFFGAKLSEFKLMGTEIHLENRTNSVWLVLAFLNVYFWFRCYQRLPEGGRYFDEPMNKIYDEVLIRLARLRRGRHLYKKARCEADSRNLSDCQIVKKITITVLCQKKLEAARKQNADEVCELYQIDRRARTQMIMTVNYAFTPTYSEMKTFSNVNEHYTPNLVEAWLAKGLAIIVGIFVTPWFTDYLMPLLLGMVSTIVATSMWYKINYLFA